MTCPLCVGWKQKDPNCGHGFYNGIHAPAKTFTFAFVMTVELGELAAWHMAIENTRNAGEQTIAHRAHRAGHSVWKVPV